MTKPQTVSLPPTNLIAAALLMLSATLVLSLMHALVRYLSADLHPFVIAFFRNLFGFVAILPMLLRAGRVGLVTHQPKLQALRGGLGAVAMLAWFYGLSIVPIAEATALSFTSALFATLAAVILLGEQMRIRRWTAVALGFLGALIILRPGLIELKPGTLIILLSALCWGTNVIIVKRLGQTDSTVSIITWMSLTLALISLFPALWVWRQPTGPELFWLAVIGILGTTGHFAMVNAFKRADATVLIPLDFTRLIWTSVIGYWIFSEQPDRWTYLGGMVIFGSAIFITYREAQLLKRKTAINDIMVPPD